MTIVTSLGLAFSLSMDAFAASMGKGAALHKPSVREAARIGAYFGFFELIAPLVGWVLGLAFAGHIAAVDHWVAFVLLLLVGGRMSWLALFRDEEETPKASSHAPLVLVLVAIGTSVDATAVGVTLHTLEVHVPATIALIGAVTFTLAFGGVLIGRAAGPVLGRWAEFFGGLGLIAIGTRVLLEHTIWQ